MSYRTSGTLRTRTRPALSSLAILLVVFGIASTLSASPKPPLFTLEIKDVGRQLQAHYVDVDVKITCATDSAISRIYLAIAYDLEALSFAEAIAGDLVTTYSWDYFNFSFGPAVDCRDSGRCGVIRVTAASDDPYGDSVCPSSSDVNTPLTLVTLRFLITNDRAYQCLTLPLQFVWLDCIDNTILSGDCRHWYHSAALYDTVGSEDIHDPATLPSYTGAPDECLSPDLLSGIRAMDLYNGHVGIICPETLDYRGDVNCNGLSYEIADYVMLANYFVLGAAAFNGHGGCSLANSDANADGLEAGLDDLLCIGRRLADPDYDCFYTAPLVQDYVYENGILSISGVEVGLAHIVVQGNVTPVWLLGGTDFAVAYAYDAIGDSTSILVSPSDFMTLPTAGFAGPFINLNGADIRSVAMVTLDGTPIVGGATDVNDGHNGNLPVRYELLNSYPNPFNATTIIPYALPRAGSVQLTIFNLTGQTVRTLIAGNAPAGRHSVAWDGTDDSGHPVASGIYMYRLIADDFDQTRRMILLK